MLSNRQSKTFVQIKKSLLHHDLLLYIYVTKQYKQNLLLDNECFDIKAPNGLWMGFSLLGNGIPSKIVLVITDVLLELES